MICLVFRKVEARIWIPERNQDDRYRNLRFSGTPWRCAGIVTFLNLEA
jgi:hypothetical protein